MGLFSRKSAIQPTGHPGDDQLLGLLSKTPSGLGVPRHWLHYVYAADEAGAAHLEARASEAGWSVARVVPEYHGIVAERADLAVDRDSVIETRGFFELIASEVEGGEYDGWEADAS